METKSCCCYCGTGCGVVVESEGDRITGVRGDPDHPANAGRLCTKGATLHLTADGPGRLLHPALRHARGEAPHRVSWPAALDHAAQRFADALRQHGPDSVAFYVSGQLLTEEQYVFGKLARALVGTNNIDANTRLGVASAVTAYQTTLGADGPPCCYDDIDAADCILIAGANPACAHPILFDRIEAARRTDPQPRLIVVDPRRTDTAARADLHLALLPGTDIVLFNAMLHVMLAERLVNDNFIREHTAGFDAWRDAVRQATPAAAEPACGVPAADIVRAARWFGGAQASLSLWCQGLNQSLHGTHNAAALIQLHLATGHIGRPGAGPLALAGQSNALGTRLAGAMATLLPGQFDPHDVRDRARLAAQWDVAALPARPGKTAIDMFEALRVGRIKALWIAATDPAHSLPDQWRVREALEAAEFVVMEDAYAHTATASYADVLLPAAAWGEKEGTQLNAERRVSRARRAVAPPGEALPDWRIARDFALRLGQRLGRSDAARLFHFFHPAQIFAEHARLTRDGPCDVSGLSYALLDERGPQRAPFAPGAAAGAARLYTGGIFATADGRARFIVPRGGDAADPPDAVHALRLTTGRLRDQWHAMSRSGRVPQLYAHDDEPCLYMHCDDLAQRHVRAGELVLVSNRRGETVLRAAASDALRPGQCFIAMHWGRRFLNSGGANELMPRASDALSKQPELKHTAVNVVRAALGWHLWIMRAESLPGDALRWMQRLQPLLDEFCYASVALAHGVRDAVVLRAAHPVVVPPLMLDEIDLLLDLRGPGCLRYIESATGLCRRALVEDDTLSGMHLAGDVSAAPLFAELILSRRPCGDALEYWSWESSPSPGWPPAAAPSLPDPGPLQLLPTRY